MSAPVPQPAPNPIAPIPLEDRGNSGLTSYLGLPFYYRHAPGPVVKRLGFYAGLILILLVMGGHLLFFPYPKDTWQSVFRAWMFGYVSVFESNEQGYQYLFSWFFVLAMLFSGIFAPLWATFSFAGEKVTGTMEFLRLSPMSTSAIIMGKTFAAAFPMHIFSGVCLVIGAAFGLAGGTPLVTVIALILIIIASSAVANALGVNLATMSSAFRGFSPLALWILVAWAYYGLPMTMVKGGNLKFIAFLSPWGAMDTLIWQTFQWRFSSGYGEPAQFFGSEHLALLFPLAANGIFLLLLVRSAARKLDDNDSPMLTPFEYAMLWVICLGAALGGLNYSTNTPGMRMMEAPSILMLVSGMALVLVMMGDHPVRREKLLTKALEYFSTQANPRKRAPGLGWTGIIHALCVFTFSLMTMLAFGGLVYFATNSMGFEWDIYLIFLILVPPGMALLSACSELGGLFANSPFFRFLCGFTFSSVCIGLIIGGMVYCGVTYNHWYRSVQCKANYFAVISSGGEKATSDQILSYGKELNGFELYTGDLNNAQEVTNALQRYQSNLPLFMARYHPLATALWGLVYLGMIFSILLIRYWAYGRISKLAQKALQAEPTG